VDILDGMGVSKLSAKVFFKVHYSFNNLQIIINNFLLYLTIKTHIIVYKQHIYIIIPYIHPIFI